MLDLAIALATLITCLSAGATLSTVTGDGGTVYFSVIVSNAPATLNTSGVLSAVDRSIQLINSDPTILPRHSLQRSLLSTQVSFTSINHADRVTPIELESCTYDRCVTVPRVHNFGIVVKTSLSGF